MKSISEKAHDAYNDAYDCIVNRSDTTPIMLAKQHGENIGVSHSGKALKDNAKTRPLNKNIGVK